MFYKICSFIVLASLFITACTPTQATPMPQTPTPYPTQTPIPPNVRHHRWTGSEYMTCPVTFLAVVGETTLLEEQASISFDSGAGVFSTPDETWLDDWNYKTDTFGRKAAAQFERQLTEMLGLSSIWNGERLFSARLAGQQMIPDIWYDTNCPSGWTVKFDILPDYPFFAGDWTIIPKIVGGDLYVTVSDDNNNEIEVPLYPNDLSVIVSGNVPSNVTFTDPAANVGAESYEQVVLDYAIGIRSEGVLVGRFGWVSIQGQDVIHNILAHAMLIKAASSGRAVHQPAFFAYLRDRTVTTTSLVVSTKPVSGTFFLGIGGGGSSVSFNQTVITLPEMRGDLYLLSQ